MTFPSHASPASSVRHVNALDALQLAPIEQSEDEIAVAFIGTYGPRRCGIATFTYDLATAVAGDKRRVLPTVLAVTEPGGRYEYPPEVKFEIRHDVKGDYARAAEFVNFNRVRLVCIQHEYGIFGGDDGGYILDFVHALRVPAIVTLHTVLKHPSENQAAIVRKLAAVCPLIIVMSQVAKNLLASSYGVEGANVRIIPHGIPVMDLEPDQRALKAKFGVAGRRELLTYGRLGPNTCIETVIRALTAVVERFPDLIYFVVGATHPAVLRREGEAYRTMLAREAERLGVRDHLVLHGQFVSADELRRYLQAADIFVSPYLSESQVTSGALSYAMGAGAAVVSTPYWHAQELLASERGRLFPFKDHAALSNALLELLGSPAELRRVRAAAFDFAGSMAWPRIGDAYFEAIDLTLRQSMQQRETAPLRGPGPAITLPELRLDHLRRLTDDTGIIQHATYSVPARRTGYCVDDNARALIVALHADRVQSSTDARALVTTYLSYLHCSQEAGGGFRNYMSYERALDIAPPSDDCIGRAIWALGVATEIAQDEGCRLLAREMFVRALPHARALGPRGTAQCILGLSRFVEIEPSSEMRGMLDGLTAKLRECYRAYATDDWHWFEPTLTYDNALLPLALFAAYGVTGDRATLRDARESLAFLEGVCFAGDRLQLVGNTGWHSKGGEKPCADEQAIDAAAFVLAFRCAYTVTQDRHYLRRMREAFAWFLGANRLGLPLYDFSTGGCRDGMGLAHLNQNQGAESTICFLMSLLTMLELAGEEMDAEVVREAAARVQ
jgi:glycosyltransferase involved in cell wall biosynthesis